MRVLGVDPGLTRCGVGVVDAASRRRVELVDVGVIATDQRESLDRRLLGVHCGIAQWIERTNPDVVAIERVFAQENRISAMATAQAAGVAMLAAAQAGLPVALHTPTEVKAAVSGSGQAGKAQVQAMVTRILGLTAAPKPADAADALAIAICHAWRGGPIAAEAKGSLTPAQSAWAAAEAAARRSLN